MQWGAGRTRPSIWFRADSISPARMALYSPGTRLGIDGDRGKNEVLSGFRFKQFHQSIQGACVVQGVPSGQDSEAVTEPSEAVRQWRSKLANVL